MAASFILYRYTTGMPHGEFLEALERNAGTNFAYRTIVVDETDKDHVSTLPQPHNIDGSHTANVWSVAKKLIDRDVAKVAQDKKSIWESKVPTTDEWQHTRFITIANMDIIAVENRYPPIGLAAHSAINRFKIYCGRMGVDFSYDNMTTNDDLKKALNRWKVRSFSFALRPFNPHPTKRAEKFNERLKENDIGKFTGKMTANGDSLTNIDDGFIKTVVDFQENNYASISFTGETDLGHQASIKSNSISGDKEKDDKRAERNKVFKITVEVPEDEVIINVGRSMIEIYNAE